MYRRPVLPRLLCPRLRVFGATVFLVSLWTLGFGQDASTTAAPFSQPSEVSLRELREEVRELKAAVADMRAETARYREEARQLRSEVEAARSVAADSPSHAYESAPSLVSTTQSKDANMPKEEHTAILPPAEVQLANSQERSVKLEEEYQLLSGKVDEHYQSKVESASKYRVRLSGIVLLNLFANKGIVENQDFPTLPLPVPAGSSSGSAGATLRQSQLGLEVFGPRFAGARTSADVQMDFAGGFQNTYNGVNSGLVRLRTATARLDWQNTSIVAGQDGLFFSPGTPTSFASLAVPALSYAGNLWSWTPQIRVEHRFAVSENSSLLLQGDILDNLNGDFPADPYFRSPQPGELSRQPAYATRVAWSQTVFGQKLTLGGGSYFGRQNYGYGRNVNGWATMSDWNLPLSHWFSLSGKFYRGRAVGGLGAAIGTSVAFAGDPSLPGTPIVPLNVMGGWSQLKFRPTAKLEFNAAFGQESIFTRDVRAGSARSYFNSVVSNRGMVANTIFRPRSDLLFSAEYHHLGATALYNENHTANQVNLMMGVLF